MTTRWQDIIDEKEKYSAYLCSREWAETRNAVRARCGGICERCKRYPMDATHHLNYQRRYFERLTDLQGICDQCHQFTHGHSDHDPCTEPERFAAAEERPIERMPTLAELLELQAFHRARLGLDHEGKPLKKLTPSGDFLK